MNDHGTAAKYRAIGRLLGLLFMAACSQTPATKAPIAAVTLVSTPWQIVKFQGSDDTVLRPDDKSKYTLTFNAVGNVAVRLDCNRGQGAWKSPNAKQLELGPLALTRAMCAQGSWHDRIVKHWSYIRSYVIRDGHLYLSLMADGGIYEFEPVPVRK
jgi:para-nitrobenzyl esterase